MITRVSDFRDYMTLSEAAAELAVSKSRVEQYVRDGRLAVAARAGGVRFVLRSDVVRLKRTPRRPPGRPASTASRPPE
jgi:excisionase family DNA binding protein